MKKKLYIFCIALVAIFLSACSRAIDKLNIAVLKIGKADAIVLEIDQTTAVLIDTGEDEDAAEILAFLQQNKITQLDYLIITHYDKDHVGGADKIVNSMPINQMIQSNYIGDNEEYIEYMQAVEEKAIPCTKPTENYSFWIGNAEVTIDVPQKEEYKEKQDNNSSLVIWVQHGENCLLFAGDAQQERLEELLSENLQPVTFLKVPHHGKYDTLMDAFIKAVTPQYAVITCSEKNMPDTQILQLLEEQNTQTFLTKDGDVFMISDEKHLKITQ